MTVETLSASATNEPVGAIINRPHRHWRNQPGSLPFVKWQMIGKHQTNCILHVHAFGRLLIAPTQSVETLGTPATTRLPTSRCAGYSLNANVFAAVGAVPLSPAEAVLAAIKLLQKGSPLFRRSHTKQQLPARRRTGLNRVNCTNARPKEVPLGEIRRT